jgi:RHS repeat-associated protein
VDNANELLTNGPTTYTYDANGNRLTETGPNGTLTYAWDSRNRLSSITDASGNTTTMHYDFARNLMSIGRTTAGATTTQKFVVDSLTNVVSLTDPSGLPVSVLTGRSIDSHYASVDSSGNVAFGIADQLGTTVAVTNTAGAIATKLDYEPYGQTTGAPPSTYPFAYTGRIEFAGSIYYNRNRFYDSATGRFLSEDPWQQSQYDYSLYAYAQNSPLTFADQSGLAPWSYLVKIGWSIAKDFGKGKLEDKLISKGGQDWECLTGIPGISNGFDFAWNALNYGSDVTTTATAISVTIGAIAIGASPVLIVGGAALAIYGEYKVIQDTKGLIESGGRILKNETSRCGCS